MPKGAKPSLGDRVMTLMADHGSAAPGYQEPDGTKYRVIDFHADNVSVPDSLKSKFEGAIAEWANDADEATGLTLYESRDRFGLDFANIDVCAERIL